MASTDDLAWNTTRCNRLLRPLSTKLAKLRKELQRPISPNEDRRSSATVSALKASSRMSNASQVARKPRGLEKRKDPDWMPDAASGAASKKTYGGRGGRKSVSRSYSNTEADTRPGAIAFTPLIARTAGRVQESPLLQGSPSKKYSRYRGPLLANSSVHELRTQMPAEIGKLVKGMSEAYANLLQATTTGDEKKWTGTRSLMSSCLRKLPQYIELEEHFARLDKGEDDNDESDMSQEIYAHLEEHFETRPGQGWRGFKQVVRAHGTSLLCDALAEQIVGLETLQLLVVHCLNAAAWDEAERFLWAFLPTLKPLPMPNTLYVDLFDEQRSAYMSMVKDFVTRTSRYRFLFDHLEYMISQELLPLEWLATECMRPVWDRLVRSLSDGDQRSSQSAFRFLETAICAGIGLPDESLFEAAEIDTVARQFKPSSRQEFRDALDMTYSSLFTVFCSIALINRSREEPAGQHTVERVTWVLDSIVIDLLKRKDIQDDLALLGPLEENMQLFAQRAVWAVFASFLVHLEGCQQNRTNLSLDIATVGGAIAWIVSQYSSQHIDSSELLTTLPVFVSAAARGTGRVWRDDGFDQIQRLVQAMLSISGLRLPHKLWTLKRLALESVMDFARSTNKPQHMAYAQRVEQSMRSKGHVVIAPTPQKNDSPSVAGGFRWEEGIGEWVACTPFTKESVKRVLRKPIPALQLLPSPEASDDENLRGLNKAIKRGIRPLASKDALMWEPSGDYDDADDDIPQSSPIKKTARRSTSVLGKRSHAASPVVIIPAKRIAMTPPDTPVPFFSESDLEQAYGGPWRSRRSKGKNAAVASTRHARLSLRNVERKTYEEIDVDQDLMETSASDDESEDLDTSFSSRSSGGRQRPGLRAARSTSSVGKRKSRIAEGDSRDLYSKPPVLERRRSGRQTSKRMREWWKVDSAVMNTDVSEDELCM